MSALPHSFAIAIGISVGIAVSVVPAGVLAIKRIPAAPSGHAVFHFFTKAHLVA